MSIHINIAKEAEERKDEIEDLRNIPADLIMKVKEAGLVKMWTAKQYKGGEKSVMDVVSILRSMAYYNGSLAWVVGITNCSSLFSGYMPSEKAHHLYLDPLSMIGGFAGPTGIATLDTNGITVSGRWSWGSGISHCSHIVGGIRVVEGTQVKATGIAFFQPSEILRHDNWYVLGLKGSNSIDYSVENLFVPNDRWSYFPQQKAVLHADIYRFSFLGALSLSVAAVGLGLAQRAIDEITNLAQTKSPFGQGKKLAQRAIFQSQFAKIMGDYAAADALITNAIEKVQKEISDNGTCSMESKGAVRLASCHATSLSSEIVNTVYKLGGGTSLRKTCKIEELMRDMNVVRQHGMVSEGNYRTVGALGLGNSVPEQIL